MKLHRLSARLAALRAWLLALAIIPVMTVGLAATTDVANAPLFTSSSIAIKPNVMFILDDSGSMKNDYLPDAASFAITRYGKSAFQCNGVAYNSDYTYPLPVDATGTLRSAASLTFITASPTTQLTNTRSLTTSINATALVSGVSNFSVVVSGTVNSNTYENGDVVTFYQSNDTTRYIIAEVTGWNSSTKRLDVSVQRMEPTLGALVGTLNPARVGDGQPKSATYFKYTGSQKRLGFTYSTTGAADTGTTFYRECNSTIGNSPGSGVFTPVTVTNASAEAQNYANWYQYYSNRMAMMKSSVSLAFKNLDNRYRVGFSTISSKDADEGTDFLNIRDFDATQKGKFYTAFNAANPSISTPLRGALAKAGQYYANKATNQTYDPVQYSCQKNFSILSTDGYWNSGYESSSAPKYGPYKLNNTDLVGQQDGAGADRPFFDGNTITRTNYDRWTVTVAYGTITATPQSVDRTSVRSTTTYTPVAGQSGTVYSQTLQLTAINRPASGSPVTVNTGSPHGLTTGDTVVVSGGSVTGYNGTVVITVTGATTFSYPYTSSSRPASPSAASTYTVTLSQSQGCSAGQFKPIARARTRDELSVVTSTLTVDTETFSTSTLTLTRSEATRYTRTTVYTNGSLTYDNTFNGATTVANSNVTATSSRFVTSSNVVTTAASTSYTAWVTAAPTGATGACVATLPSPATGGATATSTFAFSTTTGPTTPTSVTTTSTAVVSTFGPTTSTSPISTASATATTAGSENSLADVAMYYYQTDLRDSALSNCTGSLGVDVCANNVAKSSTDPALWQHMTTFTLGLGVSGLLNYIDDYLTSQDTTSDYNQILNGPKNWPIATNDNPRAIDDLWHAAVNGRGQYFSAGDPTSLTNSLNSALAKIDAVVGSASAASTSSLQPVEGDNDIFVATFTSKAWTGDIKSYQINPDTGALAAVKTWSVAEVNQNLLPSARTIYYASPSGASALRPFTYTNLTADGLNGLFDNFCGKPGAGGVAAPAQCSTLSTTTRTFANLGSSVVNYLRGDRTRDDAFRVRFDPDAKLPGHILGDVINASPLFVGKPSFRYTENNYTTFANTTRTAVVLAGSNDGMLHAFSRATGEELWAFIPSAVMPRMYKLADIGYESNHEYFVDGSPQMGDIFVGGVWKTIVVGGLNAGGRSYYALDVTIPTAPKLLWEFKNDDLGLSFGNPIITKDKDGTWIVAFGSGYNNVSPGNGNGHLFILNANTGVVMKKIATGSVGDTTTPSGFSRINGWIASENSNQALRFYGGDLLGNFWRIDTDGLIEPKESAMLLAQLKVGSTPQPITVKPILAEVDFNGSKYPVAYVATGKYLGTTDLTNTATQSIYAIKDPLTNTPYGDLRLNSTFVEQTMVATTDSRTVSSSAVNWATNSGWKIDFPGPGERVNVNPQLVLNTIFVGTNIPKDSVCEVGGSSFLYKLDIASGSTASGQSVAGTSVGSVLVQGLTSLQLRDGRIVTIVTRSDGTLQVDVGAAPSVAGSLKRTAWRELID